MADPVDDEREPQLPSILDRLSTDEYTPPQYDPGQRRAVDAVVDAGATSAHRVNRPLADYWSSRLGTATGLLELNEAFDVHAYAVPDEARFDAAAADEAFSGPDFVIDVQTHFMADRPELQDAATAAIAMYRNWGPDWWKGLDNYTFHTFARYLDSVFVRSETTVAVLTALPPDSHGLHYLTNTEMAETRELLDRMAGAGRLLNHTVIHPTLPGELEAMEDYRDRLGPAGWKVYTTGIRQQHGRRGRTEGHSWMLDDERFGIPFLERSRELGISVVCSHKGLSEHVDNGSPRDIGPCAKAFPDLNFLIYHSAFEPDAEEGPYTAETAHLGVNRLITTAQDNGIGPGGNIFPELGTTWYCLVKRPIEAAHVIGKLLVAFGEDNVLWGTDSTWYGPAQPVLDAFKAFQIPETLREQYGYPELTPELKAKILGLNASKVYGIDVEVARQAAATDDVAWVSHALHEHEAQRS